MQQECKLSIKAGWSAKCSIYGFQSRNKQVVTNASTEVGAEHISSPSSSMGITPSSTSVLYNIRS